MSGGPAGYGSSDLRGASNQSKVEHSDVERESTRRPNTGCDLIAAVGRVVVGIALGIMVACSILCRSKMAG